MDFNITTKQDVFIYIGGNSINPSASYQQTTRCRNIDTLYFYCESGQRNAEYESLEDVKEYYKTNIEYLDKHLIETCTYVSEDDRIEIIDDKYYNIYCYNEYLNDTYKTNKLLHYEHILKNEGFIVECDENPKQKLDKYIREEIDELVFRDNDDLFNSFLTASADEKKNNERFKQLLEACEILNLDMSDSGLLDSFREVLLNKNELKTHFNVCRLFKDNKSIDKKIATKSQTTFRINLIKDSSMKITILRDLENYYNLKHLEIITKDLSNIEFKKCQKNCGRVYLKLLEKTENNQTTGLHLYNYMFLLLNI